MENIVHINLGFTNVYLLRTDSGFIQVDTGYDWNVKKYLKILKKKNIKPNEIKLIIVNHAHFDHIGSIKEIKEITGAQILVHEHDKEFLIKGISAPVCPNTILSKILMSIVPKSWTVYEPIEPDIVTQDNYSLEEYGVKAKVIHTPGHTLGTVSVITEDGEAIIGCNAQGVPIRLKSSFPRIAGNVKSVTL